MPLPPKSKSPKSLNQPQASDIPAPEYRSASVPTGFLVFTGGYELFDDFDEAYERLKELNTQNYDQPTVISVPLDSPHKDDVLGFTLITTPVNARAGAIE